MFFTGAGSPARSHRGTATHPHGFAAGSRCYVGVAQVMERVDFAYVLQLAPARRHGSRHRTPTQPRPKKRRLCLSSIWPPARRHGSRRSTPTQPGPKASSLPVFHLAPASRRGSRRSTRTTPGQKESFFPLFVILARSRSRVVGRRRPRRCAQSY